MNKKEETLISFGNLKIILLGEMVWEGNREHAIPLLIPKNLGSEAKSAPSKFYFSSRLMYPSWPQTHYVALNFFCRGRGLELNLESHVF